MPPPDESRQTQVVDALFPVAVDTAYSYRAPRISTSKPGDFVAVPLGTRIATGVVWAARAGGGGNLKSSSTRNRTGRRSAQTLRDFVDWVARWTLSPRGSRVAHGGARAGGGGGAGAESATRATGKAPAAHHARARARAGGDAKRRPMPKSEARRKRRGCSAGVIDGLVDDGALEAVALPPEPVAPPPDPDFAPPRAGARSGRGGEELVAGRRDAAPSRPSCSKASPAPARRRSISRRSPPRCAPAARPWC